MLEEVGNQWIGAQSDLLLVHVFPQVVDLVFDAIQQLYARIHFAGSVATDTYFLGGNFSSGTNAFTGNLHQTKFTHWQDGMSCTVCLHGSLQSSEQFVLLLWVAHVDKVDHNNPTHIAQSHLTCDFINGFEVHFEHIFLAILLVEGGATGVDIDYVKCFGMVDDEVGAAAKRYIATEAGLDLAIDVVLVEKTIFSLMEF